MAVGTNRRR